MGEDRQSGASELLSKGAGAARTIQGAVKTGKAIAGVSKGTAAGGPYGAAAMAVWQNRKLAGKILAAAAFLMMLPVLFILMLPSLVFGGLDSEGSTEIPIMNDNAAIYANIEEINCRVHEALTAAHDAVLEEVQELRAVSMKLLILFRSAARWTRTSSSLSIAPRKRTTGKSTWTIW